MKKGLLGPIVAALLLLAGVGWYVASPALALSELKDALISGRRDEVAERVDFPALRESLKGQFMAAMTAEAAKNGNEPGAQFGMVFATAMISPMIDAIVTPDGLNALVQRGKFKAPGSDPGAPNAAGQTEWIIEREGLDRFSAVPKAAEGQKVSRLVFKRDGLGWRLSDILIPQGGLGK